MIRYFSSLRGSLSDRGNLLRSTTESYVDCFVVPPRNDVLRSFLRSR